LKRFNGKKLSLRLFCLYAGDAIKSSGWIGKVMRVDWQRHAGGLVKSSGWIGKVKRIANPQA
jgi:hypothetical protein